ncbi:hypothetical protein [Nostoc sp. C117]|uniref:hypothetical protein n=1 Tax=Nostoc sp. C117 TaxID=3349875 RepID=UPI00370D4E35
MGTCTERTCTEFRLRSNRATCTERRRSESRFNYRKAEVAEVAKPLAQPLVEKGAEVLGIKDWLLLDIEYWILENK